MAKCRFELCLAVLLLGSVAQAAPLEPVGTRARGLALVDLGDADDVEDLKSLTTKDPGLMDPTWVGTAAAEGKDEAKMAMAQNEKMETKSEAHIAEVEMQSADADVHEATQNVKATSEKLSIAAKAAARWRKQAIADDVENDRVKRKAMQLEEKFTVDEEAPDQKQMLDTTKQSMEARKRELEKGLEEAQDKATRSSDEAKRAKDTLAAAKAAYSNAKQEQMIALSMRGDAKDELSVSTRRAVDASRDVDVLQTRADKVKKLEPKKLPEDWEMTGEYALDNNGHLVHVRHAAVDKQGMRKITTMVGGQMVDMVVNEDEAAQLDPKNYALLTINANPKTEKVTLPAPIDGDNQDALDAFKAIPVTHTYARGMPQEPTPDAPMLGEAGPTKLIKSMWAKAHWAKPEPPITGADSGHKTNIMTSLAKVNAITAILNRRVRVANKAADAAMSDMVGGTAQRVNALGQSLRLGAANVLRMAKTMPVPTGVKLPKRMQPRTAVTAQVSTSATENSTVSGGAARPTSKIGKSLLHDANNQVRALKKKLKMKDIMLKLTKAKMMKLWAQSNPQHEATQWAKAQVWKATKDANSFDGKMVKVNAAAKRKKISMVQAGLLMKTEEAVARSAANQRMADYLADKSVTKFKKLRMNTLNRIQQMPRLKKIARKTASEFKGYGPKMDPERAQASAQARATAAAREDAKARYERDDANLKVGLAAELRLLKESLAEAQKMMLFQQKQLKEQRVHYEYRIKAEQYRTKAEIYRRTSCKDIKGQLDLASRSCECKNMNMWSSILMHDKRLMDTVKLKSERDQCKRDVEACKFAYRKQGFVWMQPPKKTTKIKYAVTGKTKDQFLLPYPRRNDTSNSTNSTVPRAVDGAPKKANMSYKDYNELGEEIGDELHSTDDVTAEDFENDGVDMWESHRIAQHGRGR